MTCKETRLNIPVNWFCNQKCIFCSETDKKEHFYLKEKRDDFFYGLIDEGKKTYNSIMFTTGEPTLNLKLDKYISYAKKQGYENIALITNGVKLVCNEYRKKILEAGITEITFSIHGSNHIIHDYITGVDGSYNNAILALIKTRKESKDTIIYTSFVLNRLNLKDFYNYAYKFSKLCITKIIVNTMRPEGFGKIKMKYLSINYNEFVDYIQGLGKDKLLFINKLIETNKLLIIDIPICIIKRAGININAYAKMEKIDTLDNGEQSVLDNTENKVYLEKCKFCEYKKNCEGIYLDYLNKFGEKDFVL